MGIFEERWDVTCGHCTCKQVCSNIAALLYALDCAVKRLEEKRCTDGPRQWGLPSVKVGKALYEEATAIDFSNPSKKHNKSSKSFKDWHSKEINVSLDAIEKFYKDLDGAASTTSEKSGLLSILAGYWDYFQPKVISQRLPQLLTELHHLHNRNLSASELMMKCEEVSRYRLTKWWWLINLTLWSRTNSRGALKLPRWLELEGGNKYHPR